MTTAPPAPPSAPAPPEPPGSPPPATDRAEPRRRPTGPARLGTILAAAAALALVGVGLIPIAVVVLSLPFLFLLAFRPVLRRLAIRNVARRPREALLIVVGALLGTAIITSALVVGDTLTTSIHQSAYTQLGPLDEAVLSVGAANGQRVADAVAAAHLNGVDGTLPLFAAQAAVSAGGGASARAEPRAQVIETDFTRARAFGGDPSATGISGGTPAGDHAAIGTDLAKVLGVGVGDPVTVYLYGATRTLTIDRVLPRLGVAGLTSFTNFTGSTSPNLFVPPGTLTALQNANPLGSLTAPPVSVLAVSNRGNVTSGARLTAQVHGELVAALRGVPALVNDSKQNLIDAANSIGKGFSTLFVVFGAFSVAVGILLLVNIFVMLAQERKQSLGMLRAVGLRRASLVGSFSLEGWLYALVSALAGMLVGIGIGRLVIVAASRIFSQAGGRRVSLTLQFSASRHSLQNGFLAGFVIALLTVVLTSLYVAFINVIRAIRDLPEPPHDDRRLSVLLVGVLLSGVGAAFTVTAVSGNGAIAAIVGPAVLGLGVLLLLLGRTPLRPTVSIVASAVVVWTIAAPGVLAPSFQKASLNVYLAEGLVLNVFAVVLVTVNQQTIGGFIRSLGGGARNMSLRLGLAYPLARRFRTGMLLAMYAIVVFVLVLLTTISQFFSGQVNDQIRKVGGGAGIIVDSNPAEPVAPADVQRLSGGVRAIAPTSAVTTQFQLVGSTAKFRDFSAVGFDDQLVGNGAPNLHDWARHYRTQADVYRAVAADPTTVIVGRDFASGGFGPGGATATVGSAVTLRDAITGQTTTLTIVGVVDESRYDGVDHVYLSRTLSDRLFGNRSVSNLLFVSTAPGTDNDALAAAINARYVASGADASSFRRLVNDSFAVQNEFLTLIRGYVALGLLVGIAGLGVVMVRAVRERRREVGVLRALGFSSVAVRRAFLAESSFIAAEGIGVGTILALITAWRLVNSGNFGTGTAFTVPWLQVVLLVAVTFAASIVATAAPAIQASRIRPAVALRISD
ncbi:MAG TPA: FtsX-like permease family protein [Acidimicrobiales bacterium]|nr:FtsX-like permease family protein [Acidimicrobiales bacterium]